MNWVSCSPHSFNIRDGEIDFYLISNSFPIPHLSFSFLAVAESPQSSKLKSENARLSADMCSGGLGVAGASASLSDTNSCDTSADDNVERLRKELKVAREQILRKLHLAIDCLKYLHI